eukprot:GSMAST32.ASY1.ANO1.1739.1 assembled CDS
MIGRATAMATRQRIFSGIQPTGHCPHLGNYLGALVNWESRQHDPITTYNDGGLRSRSRSTAAALLACGIDPEKSTLFVQSDVPEHSELSWILSCFTQMSHLNRMTQFKQKSGKDRSMSPLGLYAYPVLQAADILLYQATVVPVGDDQCQHIELCREIASRFNYYENKNVKISNDTNKENENEEKNKKVKIVENTTTHRVSSLRDGLKKMSKSDLSTFSRIDLTDSADLIEKKIKKAKTDAIQGPLTWDPIQRPGIQFNRYFFFFFKIFFFFIENVVPKAFFFFFFFLQYRNLCWSNWDGCSICH